MAPSFIANSYTSQSELEKVVETITPPGGGAPVSKTSTFLPTDRMNEPVYVGAYWGNRPESAGGCAARAIECVRSLGELSVVLGQWKPKGRSSWEALFAADIPEERLLEMFQGGVNRRDYGGGALPELGYSLSAWNGVLSTPAAISVTCGAFAARAGVLNSFVLDLPNPSNGPVAALYDPENMEEILSAVIRSWAPDWAVVTSHGLRAAHPRKPAQPVVGWFTYLGSSRTVPDELPGGLVRRLHGGSLVTVEKGWEAVQPADVLDIADALDDAGALSPTA